MFQRNGLVTERAGAGPGSHRRRQADRQLAPRPRPSRIPPLGGADPGFAYRATVPWKTRQAQLLMASDAVAVLIACTVGYLARFGLHLKPSYLFTTLVLLPAAWVLCLSLGRAYETRFLGGGHEEFRRVIDSAVRVTALVAVASYVTKMDVARLYVLMALLIATTLTFAGRVAGRLILLRLRAKGSCQSRVLIVGTGEDAAGLIRMAKGHPLAGWNVVGVCLNRPYGRRSYDRKKDDGDLGDVPIVGTFADVIHAVRATEATAVAVSECPELEGSTLRQLMWDLEGTGVDVLVGSALTEVTGPRLSIRPLAGLPLLHVEEPELTGARRLLKGLTDRSIALVMILLASPLLIALGLAVRLSSRGPAIFTQTRVGRHGKTFTMFKFRSMYVDAEQRLAELQNLNERGEGLLFKMKNDPRITRVGGFLRKWSLDELPQLFNVLNGKMSLVGPRPPLPREVAQYGNDVRRRLLVKPGLTGLWQVSGRSDLPWDESVRLDLGYVENWSLAMDLVILARTIVVVLRRSGAY
jgi:exopolysaccharide biosynthesis polyprenyl glycosylphosphotransferase